MNLCPLIKYSNNAALTSVSAPDLGSSLPMHSERSNATGAVLFLLYLINGHKFIHFTQSFIEIRLLLP